MDKNVNLIVEKLKKIPHCEGIIYSGSRMDGDFIATSDYDFTVLIDKGKSYYRIFRYKNLLVDICCATEEVIVKQDFRRDRVVNPELSIIAQGTILFDQSGRMKAIQKKAQKIWKLGPTNNTKEIGYLCAVFLHQLKKPNIESSYYAWSVIMSKTVRLFFELNKVWLPKSFKVESTINEIDRDFFKLYRKAYLANSKDRARLTEQMVKYIVKKFKLSQTGEIYFLKNEKQ